MRLLKWGIVAGGLVLAIGAAEAVNTKAWVTTTFREFDEGEAKGVTITSTGEVLTGRDSKRFDLGAPLAMSSVVAAGGKKVFLGTGDDGAVLVWEGGKPKPFAKLDGVTLVAALALSPDGRTLYAGGTPGGQVFAIDIASAKPKKLAKLEGGEHVWNLSPDASGKTLVAGTGPEGKLFEIDTATGKSKVLWDSGKKHLLSVTRDGDSLLVGASDEAELYRVDAKTGAARAINDFAGQEIKSIVVNDKSIYLTVNEFQGSATGTVTGPAKPTGTKPKGDAASSGVSSVPRPGERKGKGTLWRIDADGRIDQLHALSDSYFTDLFVNGQGDVFASSGGSGKVYMFRASDRTVVTAYDVDERQVLTMAGVKGAKTPLLLGTGDSGAIYELGDGAPKDATYTSKVFESDSVTRFGGMRFSADGPVTLETRSGNTAKPDKTWSGWSKLASQHPAPGHSQAAKIASPAARYLQWHARFGGGGVLRDVSVYMLPQNQRARVTEVTVGDEPTSGRKPSVTMASGTTKVRSPIVKIKWKIDNGDDDDIVYKLEYRVEGDVAWRDIDTGTGKDPFIRTDFDWNTELMGDGMYEVRVTASDERSNPADMVLKSDLTSHPFLIDNQKPVVEGLTMKLNAVTGRAKDSFSRVEELSYSIDSGDWQVAYPADGVFDDVVEAFTLHLPALAPGVHTVAVRAADEGDNVGVAQLTFRTGK